MVYVGLMMRCRFKMLMTVSSIIHTPWSDYYTRILVFILYLSLICPVPYRTLFLNISVTFVAHFHSFPSTTNPL
jgi:hypothetical protein